MEKTAERTAACESAQSVADLQQQADTGDSHSAGCSVVVIGGTSSGVGKTCLSVGLMAALRKKGLAVQAFKVGPDFLDPMHHEAATGRQSINLDGWMMSESQTLDSFRRNSAGCDIAIVEGVMGLFDGRDGKTEDGSTAQIAKWLGASVLLVLDCWALSRSAAAVVQGFRDFDTELKLGGILLNKVGSKAHTQWLREALEAIDLTAPVLGGIPKDEAVAIPERHLGLHMPKDATMPDDYLGRLAALVEAHVDLDGVLKVARAANVPACQNGVELVPRTPSGPRVRIGVARDAAFCFYYHENLRLLEANGADLVPFSPIEDGLPAHLSGVYLGGGYPERHAQRLSVNKPMRAALLAFARAGGVVYGECGGLLYLTQSLQPLSDLPSAMVGVFPFRTAMTAQRMKMGYVEVVTQPACVLFPPNTTVRGHVFHFSEILQERVVGGFGARDSLGGGVDPQGWEAGYQATLQAPGSQPVREGYSQQRVLASYVHLHFGSCPALATSLVDACRKVNVAECSRAASCAAADTAMMRASSLMNRTPKGMVPSCSSPDLAMLTKMDQRAQSADLAVLTHVNPFLLDRDKQSLTRPGHAPADKAHVPLITAPLLQHATDSAGSGFFAGHWKSPPGTAQPRRSFSANRLDQAVLVPHERPDSPLHSPDSASEDELGQHPTANGHHHPRSQRMRSRDYGRAPQHHSDVMGSSLYHTGSGGNHHPPHARPPRRGGSSLSGSASSTPTKGNDDGAAWDIRRRSGTHASTSGQDQQHLVNGRNGFSHRPLSPNNSGIVSLLPSGTEILFALGLGSRVAGVTDLCDYPPEAASVMQVSRSRVSPDLTSTQVEQRMQELKEQGEAPFELDWQALASERPGLVLTQDTCSACDPAAEPVFQALDRAGLLGPHSPTQALVLSPRNLSDVLESILEVGTAAGAEAAALQLVASLRCRLRRVASLVAGRRRPRVLSLEGLSPLCLGGQWLPEVKQLAGGADDWQLPGDKPLRIDWNEVREYAPDVLILAPCGHDVAATRAESGDLAGLPGWWGLPAVKAGAVYIVDHALFCRPGPRLVEGVELLAHILHPSAVPMQGATKGVLKLSLSGGQRCRQRLVPNYFLPLQ